MMFTFTAATINCRNRADQWRNRRHLLIAQLLDTRPNLISLQELSMPIAQGRWIRNQLNARLPDDTSPYRLIQKRKHHPLYGYYEGIGILTNLSILYHDWLNLGYGGRVALRVNVELPDKLTLDFVCTHLHAVFHDKETRHEQVMRLTGWLRTVRPAPLQIIAGDFNELPNGLAIRYMKQSFESAYERHHGYEPLATFPTALVRPRPAFDGSKNLSWAGCLDYIFLTPHKIAVEAIRIFMDKPDENKENLFPSDHVGLLATLKA